MLYTHPLYPKQQFITIQNRTIVLKKSIVWLINFYLTTYLDFEYTGGGVFYNAVRKGDEQNKFYFRQDLNAREMRVETGVTEKAPGRC